jgi:UDP-glucose 4-epimerase
MKALVTGSFGFIGSNLCYYLNGHGWKIYTIDNMMTGQASNLEDIKVVPYTNEDVDVVFHLGMPSSSPMYKAYRMAVKDCIKSSINAFEIANTNHCPMVYASSSSVYNGNTPPFFEAMQIKNTDWYTEARYFVERLAERYTKDFGVRSVGLRLFSVYGRNDIKKGQYANIVTQFAHQMHNDIAPVIFGDGKQSRDFVHVKDIVDAFIKGFEYEGQSDVFNVGTGQNFSFNTVVDMINQTYGKHLAPIYTKQQIHNYIFDTLAATTKAKMILGWETKRPFEEWYPTYLQSLATKEIETYENYLKRKDNKEG